MLNLRGAFVVYGAQCAPTAVLLSAAELAEYTNSRAKLNAARRVSLCFGINGAEYALPCTTECMERIALEYTGVWADELRQLCATIALGKPVGHSDDKPSDGGIKVRDKPVPRKPPPTPKVDAFAQLAGIGAK